MKHLVNGLAIAGVLAIAAPGWAQTNPPPPSAPPAAAAPAETAPPAPAAPAEPAPAPSAEQPSAAAPATAPTEAQPTKPARTATHHARTHHARRYAHRAPHHAMHGRMAMHHRYMSRHGASTGDNMANQLNREELNRIQGGSPPAGAPSSEMGMPPGGMPSESGMPQR